MKSECAECKKEFERMRKNQKICDSCFSDVISLPNRILDYYVSIFMGWKDFSIIDGRIDYAVGVDGYRRNYAIDPKDGKRKPFPSYSNDLSLANEASIKVFKEYGVKYLIFLAKVVLKDFDGDDYDSLLERLDKDGDEFIKIIHASPEQICKAIILSWRG